MLSLRAHALICSALFAAILLFAAVGAGLQAAGIVPGPALRWPAMILFGALFAAFALSTVPVMVKLVLGFQQKAGNQDVALIKAAIAHQNRIIWSMWGVIALGGAIAVPAAIADGAFGPLRVGEAQGLLVAAPGMTLEELAHGSTLKLNLEGRRPPISTVSGDVVFDFQVPGSTVIFPRCRYYFMSTFTHDPGHLQAVSIGTSTAKLSRSELDAADAELHKRLTADGWLAGHEVYRTAEDQQLHEGKTEGPVGRHWLKNDVVLTIGSRRMDDPAPGQDPATTGEWIQFIDLWGRKDYPGIERFVFEPPR